MEENEIPFGFQLIYQKGKEKEISNFDPERIQEIIGLKAGVFEMAFHPSPMTLFRAKKEAAQWGARLYTPEEMKVIAADRGRINCAISFLRRRGVPFEYLDGKYLVNGNEMKNYATLVDAHTGSIVYSPKSKHYKLLLNIR